VTSVYWAALIVGLGTALLQLLSGHGHADAGGADSEIDLDADGDLHAGDIDHAGDAGHDAGTGHAGGGVFLPIFLSLRFWMFALLAFGMVGAAVQTLGLASTWVTAFLAVGMGLAAGLGASWAFAALGRSQTSSGAQSRDLLGQSARVLVAPPVAGGRCKVRVELLGQTIDLLAATEDQDLREGDEVLVVGTDEETVQVSRATPSIR
jgi:membrane protein implicated in regulation of membrane protease activity